MRISTAQIVQQGVNAMLEQQAKLAETQQQLATGKRILTPSDDPAGSTRILDLNEQIETTEQYLRNADFAEGRLGLEEGTLQGVGDLLQRVRELAIQGNNDSQNAESRANIAAEIEVRLGELLALANTREANGEYLFAGFDTFTQPFTQTGSSFNYNGDDGQRFLQVGASTQVAVGDPGSDVFMLIPENNGTFVALDNPNNSGTGIIDPGSVSDPTAITGDTYSIFLGDNAGVTVTGLPAFTDTLTNDTLQYRLSINGTQVDLLGEGDARTLTQLAANIDAQSGTTGVRAFEDGTNLYLVNTAPSGQPITVTEELLGASESGDSVAGFFGTTLNGTVGGGPDTRTHTFDAEADSYIVEDVTLATVPPTVVASGSYTDGGEIRFDGVLTGIAGVPENGDTFTIRPAATQDIFTTVQNLVDALNGQAGSNTAFHNAINRVLVNLDQAMGNINDVRAQIGGRLNSIDSQRDVNQDFVLQLQTTRSNIEDLDFAEAASRLNLQLVGLQAAQQTFVRVQGLSLFNFL